MKKLEQYTSDFIVSVRSVRSMTRLLGKLGIRCMRHDNTGYLLAQRYPGANKMGSGPHPQYDYGIGIRESKDWTESFYTRLKKTIRSHTSA